ncbi:Uncharacterised protein [BD1-7 clade bacterium]|uniref:Uncharacterized protein n=1 Tax=BD1-7 clade bacterium TaxID=2029982 RepID=A0A5S9QUL1_9GAMM|nr:Uncharacterised protein [BD1-7 clade bacterium]
MDFWQLVGFGLLIWAAYDLYSGKTWVIREYHRKSQPMEYWLTLSVWIVIAVTLAAGLW